MVEGGIALENKEGLAIVTLARPERLNAFGGGMFAALEDTAQSLSGDSRLRAVVVTGSGEAMFSAGFDVNPDNPMVAEMARAIERRDKGPIETALRVIRAAVDRFVALPVPVIAALNGKAFGGGAELAVIRAGRRLHLQAALDLEQQTAVDLIASGECLHGIGAFLAGNAPRFPVLRAQD